MREPSIVRPIVVLSMASFASVATMRAGDPLLPQVAAEFGVTAGEASVIATAFALAYGFCQLVYGVLGDRFGKYRLVAGATAAAIVPLSMAFIGDQVPYEQRQTVLARFLTGTITGIICGQVFGGVLGEAVGWRAVFLLLGGLFLVIGVLLAVELRSPRVPPPRLTRSISMASLVEGYAVLLRRPWSRVVLITVCAEAFLFYGAFTFVGAYLHADFGLDYAEVGILLGLMGLGGLLYALAVRRLVHGLGERGLALYGGVVIAAGFVAVAISPLMIVAPAMVVLGLGIHMLHNTLQTNATQLAPEARGLAVSTFANVLFMGQAAGVWLSGLAIDRIGFAPVFIGAGIALLLVGTAFAQMLKRRTAMS
jgi:predicted MFS family arabinose efflux permease